MAGIHFLVAFCALMTAVRLDSVDKEACDQWAKIALKVTGSGKLHKCATRDKDCTVMDCTGATTFPRNAFLQHDIDLSYCFGMQINSCNEPLSMDFYLQLPSRNISKVYRISNDDAYELKELNFSLGPLGTAYPFFDFHFERGDTKTVNLSVVARLKNPEQPLVNTVLEDFHFTLINDQVIPVKPCEKMTQDSSKVPPKTFAPDKCQLKPYIPAMTVTGKPSDTLNKTCDLNHECGVREMCDLTSQLPKCKCIPEFSLSPKGDACLSTSKINQSCAQNEECGFNEECRGDSAKTSTCQCKQHYVYSSARDTCIIPLPGPITDNPVKNQTQTPTLIPTQKSTTVAPKSEPVKAKTSDEKHNIAIYVGGGLAGLVVFGLAIWGLVCFMRRRQRPLSINDRESSAPLIGSDDDNLIM